MKGSGGRTSGRKTQWSPWQVAFDSDLGTWASSCFADSHLDGSGVLGMDLVAEQAVERPSGPPDEAMALVSRATVPKAVVRAQSCWLLSGRYLL